MIYFRKVTFSKNDDAIKIAKKSERVAKTNFKNKFLNKWSIHFISRTFLETLQN